MSFDMSFIVGNNARTEPPSKPTEARKGQEGQFSQATPQNASQSPTAAYTAEQLELLKTAREIVTRHKISREITEGVMLQLEKDLAEGKDNLPTLILFLTEALDRVSGGGDHYIKRAEKALRDSGHTV